MDKKLIIYTEPKIESDSITIYGAGKFGESKLILNKEQAMLLYLDLHKFIKK